MLPPLRPHSILQHLSTSQACSLAQNHTAGSPDLGSSMGSCLGKQADPKPGRPSPRGAVSVNRRQQEKWDKTGLVVLRDIHLKVPLSLSLSLSLSLKVAHKRCKLIRRLIRQLWRSGGRPALAHAAWQGDAGGLQVHADVKLSVHSRQTVLLTQACARSNNQLITLTQAVGSLPGLQQWNASHNRIVSVPAEALCAAKLKVHSCESQVPAQLILSGQALVHAGAQIGP